MVGIVIILIKSYQNSHFLHIEDKSKGRNQIKMTLAEEVTFINKGAILKELDSLPENTLINMRKLNFITISLLLILLTFCNKETEKLNYPKTNKIPIKDIRCGNYRWLEKTTYLDNDIIEILEDFSEKRENKKIDIKIISQRGIVENPDSIVQFFKLRPKST